MSERDIIARIESLETKLNKALRILVEQFGEPPQRTVEGPLIYVPTQQEIDEAIREGDGARAADCGGTRPRGTGQPLEPSIRTPPVDMAGGVLLSSSSTSEVKLLGSSRFSRAVMASASRLA